MTMAENGQCVVVTPFTLAGAMSPVTIAGALAQQHAEALAGIALCQIVRPGVPVMYGGFTSNVDMRTGAPAFGTPEYAQAAYESVFALWGCVMGGVNMMMHGAGWMEGGLHASLAKMVLDADLLHMVSSMMDPVIVDDLSLAIDAIEEVGPGGHFFGVGHTQERYRTAFYRPMISDWRNFETWAEAGRPEAAAKAHDVAAAFLAAYEPPVMADDRREELEAFVAKRVAEGGVATDF